MYVLVAEGMSCHVAAILVAEGKSALLSCQIAAVVSTNTLIGQIEAKHPWQQLH